MNAVIFDFEQQKQRQIQIQAARQEEMIMECRRDISSREDRIRSLAAEIQVLQSDIDLNYRLIDKLSRQLPMKHGYN